MHYFIYKTTNTTNGKIYVGVHQSKKLEDDYLGSGKYLQQAIKKHGRGLFIRVILETFESPEAAYLKEEEIVNAEFVARTDTYNMALGGSGGSIVLNRKPFTKKHTQESKDKMSASLQGRTYSEEYVEIQRKSSWARRQPEVQREHARRAGIKSQQSRNASTEAKQQMSQRVSNSLREYFAKHTSAVLGSKRPKVACPHCGKDGAMNTMSRWHFDNCKNKTMVLVV